MASCLEQLEQRKQKLDDELKEVEKQVYNLETSYLNDSSTHGNVLKGFEGFLTQHKATSCAAPLASGNAPLHFSLPLIEQILHSTHSKHPRSRRLKRARNFKPEDRLFSLSSASSPAVRGKWIIFRAPILAHPQSLIPRPTTQNEECMQLDRMDDRTHTGRAIKRPN